MICVYLDSSGSKRKSIQVYKVRNEKGKVATATRKAKAHRDYYKQLYANKIDNLEETDKFLEKYSLQRLNQEEI